MHPKGPGKGTAPPEPRVSSTYTGTASTERTRIPKEKEKATYQKEKDKHKGKNSSAPAVEAAAPAVSICEGKGALTCEPALIALAATGDDDNIPRADIRSRLMDTGCKHDLATRATIPESLIWYDY